MGLINNDTFTFKSGATAQSTYLKVSGPAFMVQDSTSPTGYMATTTLETYYDKQARTAGKAPMQIENLQLPVDPSGVYAIIFGGLKQKFVNCSDVLDLDPGTPENTAAAEQPAYTHPPPAQPAETPSAAEQLADSNPAPAPAPAPTPAPAQPADAPAAPQAADATSTTNNTAPSDVPPSTASEITPDAADTTSAPQSTDADETPKSEHTTSAPQSAATDTQTAPASTA